MNKTFEPGDADDWDADEYTRKYAAAQTSEPQPSAVSASNPAPLSAPQSPSPKGDQSASARNAARPVPHKTKLKNFPGFMARSAMFRASVSNAYFGEPTVVRAQDCTLKLSGPKLGMRDKHVWETAIQVAKERAPTLGDTIEIELTDFARRMGSNDRGAKALSAIWKSLEKLALCRVEFELGNSCKGVGSLLSTALRHNGRIYIRLNPDFTFPALFGDRQFVLDQSRRARLPSALSQWLHDFFSTHKVPMDMNFSYLRELSGYDGTPRNFPAKLRAAMDLLVLVAPTLVATYAIDDRSRCSDSWMLKVVYGPDKPSFLPAQKIDLTPKTGRGRGGVAL